MLPVGSYAADVPADKGLIAKGEYLARMGDCVACHSKPGGKPYAGGLYINNAIRQPADAQSNPRPRNRHWRLERR